MRELYDEIKERIVSIEEMYDIIRVIDPINKSSIIIKANEVKIIKGTCYDFWKRGSACNNCISMRAYKENDTFIKIEYVSNKVFLIKAIPISINGKTYVLEMIKDISQNGEKNIDNLSIQRIINEVNDKTIIDKVSGVYNRKYIDERLPVDINNCNIHGYPLSIIKITIDYLKAIEYKYGKDIQDKVIIEFAEIAKELIVNNLDWIGRYNEDTFFIILNNMDSGNVINISRNVKDIFNNFIFKYKDINTKITISSKIYCTENKEVDAKKNLMEVYEQFYGESSENKEVESKDNGVNNKDSLLRLISEIKGLQEVLNEVCITPKDEINYEKRLEISQYLDGLIVKYMKSRKQQKI